MGPWPEYRELSRQMSAQWINFIHGGDPNGVGVPVWPRYSEGSQGLKGVFGCNLEASDSVQNPLIRSDFVCTASKF